MHSKSLLKHLKYVVGQGISIGQNIIKLLHMFDKKSVNPSWINAPDSLITSHSDLFYHLLVIELEVMLIMKKQIKTCDTNTI